MKSLRLMRFMLIILILTGLKMSLRGQIIPEKRTKSIFVTGVTFDSNTKEPLSGASFRVNHQKGFVTNETGRFSFYGFPNDTIVFTYLGYSPTVLIVPDSLKSEEYVMGVFMREQAVKLAEIIILRRIGSSSMMITQVKTDQQTMNIAQNNVDKAVVEGLTQAPKVYDADMNTRQTMRTIQMRNEYNGMLVTPENAVGLSTMNYKTFNVVYGTPIVSPGKISREMISNNESSLLLKHFEAFQKSLPIPEAADTIVKNLR